MIPVRGERPSLVRRGRVWKFGHNVDTDVMAPWDTIAAPFEERRARVLHVRPDFAAGVRAGDVVVAGRNFGCGSSREQAAENLLLLGVGVVAAESFGRIYFRNCIAIGFPNVACAGVYDACEDGEEVEVDVERAVVRNLSRGVELRGTPWTEDMLAIVRAGGLLPVLRERLGLGPGPGPR